MPNRAHPRTKRFRGTKRIAYVGIGSLAILTLITACGQATAGQNHHTSPNTAKGSNQTLSGRSPVTKPTVSINSSAHAGGSGTGQPVYGSGSKAKKSTSASSMPDATKPFQNLGQGHTQSSPSGTSKTKVPTISRGSLQKSAGTSKLKRTEQQIVEPYISMLTSLQSQYINQLYGLYNHARTEYHTTHASKLSIERKYFPKVMNLENSAQDKLNSLLFALRDKLVSHGYNTNEVNTIRNAYYAQIAQLQSQLKG